MGTMASRRLREMADAVIAKTAEAFELGEMEDEQGFCAVAATEDIAKQDFILTPGRYVGLAEQVDDGEPFETKMARLTGELTVLF
jgi:type I restriction enzyme M protein